MKFRTASRVVFAVTVLLVATPVFAATLININTADLAALETLSGIGPTKAQAILDYRAKHGDFNTIADIQHVAGIGPKTYAKIKDSITVGVVAVPVSAPVAAAQKPVVTTRVVPTEARQSIAHVATSSVAAVALAEPVTTPSPWLPYAGLGVLLAAGGVYVWHTERAKHKGETYPNGGEFDIE